MMTSARNMSEGGLGGSWSWSVEGGIGEGGTGDDIPVVSPEAPVPWTTRHHH